MVLDNKARNSILRRNRLRSCLKQVCFYCDSNNPLYLTIDHKTPKSRGGFVDDPKNVVMCCWLCNQLKGSLTLKEFEGYLRNLIELHALHKLRVIWPESMPLEFKQDYYPLEKSDGSEEEN